ncbi:DUF2252 domain-containing protein [Streptomyces sp. ICN441]|uniref:DUF2252 domain-containing protein n=1 Tax=Streptomyces tirandamycinicus TaxID=2174846 RepID=A0A2S1SUH0_9ACTN|nr:MULTISPECIES: DUF2252 domain-containing protein [Streptomyces]AWI30053.1 DUF2252 domain-containing protein [Streptomyces tirandamycinicus]TFE53344.1 DUF2252 domain-containing protein [Streptomyces sp. ICN441]
MTDPAEERERGRAVRKEVPRSSHGLWIPAADRPDPLAVLQGQASTREPDLVPVRYGRMAVSPFTYLRGSPAVMAADLVVQRNTGLRVQLCGDAHLLNFGVFASPERTLLFDLNDFDETLPGPFEWDVKRLVASVAVAARDNGRPDAEALRAARAAAESYRLSMRRLAGLGELEVWYERITAEDLVPLVRDLDRARLEARLAKARRRTSLHALEKLTEVVGGKRRIVQDPPLLEAVAGLDAASVRKILSDYRSTLPEDRRVLLDRYHFVEAARKVVGVGSVGTRCFVALLTGRDAEDPLFLQIKEAQRSVLEPHLPKSAYRHQGQRVVAGQRLLQAASDIFLGWVSGPGGRHYYWRQLRDMKGSADVATMSPALLRDYAALCGRALARAHARSGERIAIAAYLGSSDGFERAMGDFALAYADRTAEDHKALCAAIGSGAVEATPGV